MDVTKRSRYYYINRNNDNNLNNIAYYWITKFDIRKE